MSLLNILFWLAVGAFAAKGFASTFADLVEWYVRRRARRAL